LISAITLMFEPEPRNLIESRGAGALSAFFSMAGKGIWSCLLRESSIAPAYSDSSN
jgi:hypothetical protein